jgi:radical SAM superfamily enzyme YgiQ (UPF0313 family)
MRAAGCDKISFGIETGSEKIRFAGRKKIPNRAYENALKMCQKQKIKTMADYIFGHPGETLKDMFATLAFAMKLHSDYAFFHKMLPIPDSELYALYKKESGEKEPWRDFMLGNAGHPVYYPQSTKKVWVDFMYTAAWYFFYFSPLRFFKNMRELKNLNVLLKSIKTFFSFSGGDRYR